MRLEKIKNAILMVKKEKDGYSAICMCSASSQICGVAFEVTP